MLSGLSASRTSDGLDTRSARAGPVAPSADLAGRTALLGLGDSQETLGSTSGN